ncbi:MAG: hypothetical protein AAGE94_01435 [Acidobacteriota bacterium]
MMSSSGQRSRSRVLLCVLLMLPNLLVATESAPASPPTDHDRLQGTWVGRGPGGPCTITIEDNALDFVGRPDFWIDTTFTLPTETGQQQLHATIVDGSEDEKQHVGTVVVTLYKFEGDQLTLGVVNSFREPPETPPLGNWDFGMDLYTLERAP